VTEMKKMSEQQCREITEYKELLRVRLEESEKNLTRAQHNHQQTAIKYEGEIDRLRRKEILDKQYSLEKSTEGKN